MQTNSYRKEWKLLFIAGLRSEFFFRGSGRHFNVATIHVYTHIRTNTALLWAAGIKEKEEKEKKEEAVRFFVKLIYWKGVAPCTKENRN